MLVLLGVWKLWSASIDRGFGCDHVSTLPFIFESFVYTERAAQPRIRSHSYTHSASHSWFEAGADDPSFGRHFILDISLASLLLLPLLHDAFHFVGGNIYRNYNSGWTY